MMLLDKGVHPSVISEGYQVAVEKVLSIYSFNTYIIIIIISIKIITIFFINITIIIILIG
jgi:hypothetical protein